MIQRDEVLKALEVVIDPELRRSIVELGMVRSIDISSNGVVDVTVSLTTAGCPIKGHFQTSVADAVAALESVDARERVFRRAQRHREGLPPAEARPGRLACKAPSPR